MHADWTNSPRAAFPYLSAADDHRSYRREKTPKAKRKPTPHVSKASNNKLPGIHKRRNHRWAW